MPGVGEQHKAAGTTNPFDEVKPHVSEYTAQEIATLSSRLEKQLGPEYISSRPGAGGGKVHYLSADKCINLANEVFGFNGWSSSIQQVQVDFVDENQATGKVSLGLSVIVRVTLRDGTFHEDIGYGHIENCKGKAPAFEKAKKEGTTDALKRALRNFGNLLGNCVYDKEYVAKVTKLKIQPTKWDPENLHRHADFAAVKKEPVAVVNTDEQSLPQVKREEPSMHTGQSKPRTITFGGEDEFGSDDFDEADFSVPNGDHPDEVTLDLGVASGSFQRRNGLPDKGHPQNIALGDHNKMTSPVKKNIPVAPGPSPQTPNSNSGGGRPYPANINNIQRDAVQLPRTRVPPFAQANSPNTAQSLPQLQPPQTRQPSTNHPSSETTNPSSSDPSPNLTDPPVGFFTARAAESLQNNQASIPPKAPAFNPHLESPSIRKTAGIDHTRTKPVNRDIVNAPAVPSPAQRSAQFVNPQADRNRKVGMPLAAGSPLQNRGSYRPPQMKRPAEGAPGARSALGDVTAVSVNVPAEAGADAKRQKVGS